MHWLNNAKTRSRKVAKESTGSLVVSATMRLRVLAIRADQVAKRFPEPGANVFRRY